MAEHKQKFIGHNIVDTWKTVECNCLGNTEVSVCVCVRVRACVRVRVCVCVRCLLKLRSSFLAWLLLAVSILT